MHFAATIDFIVHRVRVICLEHNAKIRSRRRLAAPTHPESRSARWLHHKSSFAISSSLVECLRSMGDLDSFRKHSPDVNVFHPSGCIVRRKIAKYISFHCINCKNVNHLNYYKFVNYCNRNANNNTYCGVYVVLLSISADY